jgi:hypothetical protein
LDELSHFADSLKLHDRELEQQHRLELDKLRSGFDLQVQLEKERVKQLQDFKQSLTDELKAAAKTQIDAEHQYTVECRNVEILFVDLHTSFCSC